MEVEEDELVKILTIDRYNEFINPSLVETIIYETVDAFEFLLKCVKKELGQTYLIDMCRTIVFDVDSI